MIVSGFKKRISPKEMDGILLSRTFQRQAPDELQDLRNFCLHLRSQFFPCCFRSGFYIHQQYFAGPYLEVLSDDQQVIDRNDSRSSIADAGLNLRFIREFACPPEDVNIPDSTSRTFDGYQQHYPVVGFRQGLHHLDDGNRPPIHFLDGNAGGPVHLP